MFSIGVEGVAEKKRKTGRKHQAFKNKYSPYEFRKNLLHLNLQERPKMIIYAEGKENLKRHRASLILLLDKTLKIIIVR